MRVREFYRAEPETLVNERDDLDHRQVTRSNAEAHIISRSSTVLLLLGLAMGCGDEPSPAPPADTDAPSPELELDSLRTPTAAFYVNAPNPQALEARFKHATRESVELALFADDTCATASSVSLSARPGLEQPAANTVRWSDLTVGSPGFYAFGITGPAGLLACAPGFSVDYGDPAAVEISTRGMPATLPSGREGPEAAVPVVQVTIRELPTDSDAVPTRLAALTFSVDTDGLLFVLDGPDASKIEATSRQSEVVFQDLEIEIDDGDTTGEVYTLSVASTPELNLRDGAIVSVDLPQSGFAFAEASSKSASTFTTRHQFVYDVVADSVRFSPATATTAFPGTNFPGGITAELVDRRGRIDDGASQVPITLTTADDPQCLTASEPQPTTADAGGLTQPSARGIAAWTNLVLPVPGTYYFRADASELESACFGPIQVSIADATLEIVAGPFTENPSLRADATTRAYDLTIRQSEPDSDGFPIEITELRFSLAGSTLTGAANVGFELDGPDHPTPVIGTVEADLLTFSDLAITVDDEDLVGEVYQIWHASPADSGLQDGDTVALSFNADSGAVISTTSSRPTGTNPLLETSFIYDVVASDCRTPVFPTTELSTGESASVAFELIDSNGKIDLNGTRTRRISVSCGTLVNTFRPPLISASPDFVQTPVNGILNWDVTVEAAAPCAVEVAGLCRAEDRLMYARHSNPTPTLDQPRALDFAASNFAELNRSSLYVVGSQGGVSLGSGFLEQRDGYFGYLRRDFDSDGRVVLEQPSSAQGVEAAQGRDELYLLAVNSTGVFLEKRRRSSGALVNAFGTGGRVYVSSGNTDLDGASALDLDNSSTPITVYVAHTIDAPVQGTQWQVSAIDAETGAMNWQITSDPSSGFDEVRTLKRSGSHLYVFGRNGDSGDTVWRIEKRSATSGALDTAFGTAGAVDSIRNSNICATQGDLTVSDGAVFMVGRLCSSGDPLWRIEKRSSSDGSLDAGFGSGGVLQPFSAETAGLRAAAVSGNRLFVAGGYRSQTGFRARIAAYDTTTGALDTHWAGEGFVEWPAPSFAFALEAVGQMLWIAGYAGEDSADTLARVEVRDVTTGDIIDP